MLQLPNSIEFYDMKMLAAYTFHADVHYPAMDACRGSIPTSDIAWVFTCLY